MRSSARMAPLVAAAASLLSTIAMAADAGASACEALAQQLVQVQQRGDELHDAQRQRVGRNAIATGGALIFWPALLALRIDPAQARELQALQAQAEALQDQARRQGCGDLLQLPPAEQAALPVAVGETLVYSERGADGALHTLRLRLQRLEQRRFVFELGTEAEPGTWVQDRAGNVLTAPDNGPAYWRGLLQPGLALGSRAAGELLGLRGATAQLRTQVVAEQVKTPFPARAFDPVVLDLQGTVEPGTPAPRAQGVMVVDRRSGLLLRLELHSDDPQFDLERQLVHIEPAGPALKVNAAAGSPAPAAASAPPRP